MSNQVPQKNLEADVVPVEEDYPFENSKASSPQGADAHSKKSTPDKNPSTGGSGSNNSPQPNCFIEMMAKVAVNSFKTIDSPPKQVENPDQTPTPQMNPTMTDLKSEDLEKVPKGIDLETGPSTKRIILESNPLISAEENTQNKKEPEKYKSKEINPSRTDNNGLKVWVKKHWKALFITFVVILAFIGVAASLFSPCGILGFNCPPCPPGETCCSDRSCKDPGLKTILEARKSLVDQLLNKDFPHVFRAYLLGETVKYYVNLSRIMKSTSPFNAATGTGVKTMVNYTVWVTTLFAEKDIVGLVVNLDLGLENIVQHNSISFEKTLLTAANLSQLPLKAIQCNISRYVAEEGVCSKLNNIEDEEWMVMKSVLSQFLQVLEKKYVTISAITNGQTRILSGGKEVITRNNETLKVEGVLGGGYNKDLTFLVSKNPNSTQVVYKNEYTQDSFGLHTNNQKYQVKSRSNLDPATFIMIDAEINATLFCEADKTHIVQQRLLLNDEVPVNGVDVEYSMEIIQMEAPRIIDDSKAMNLAKLTTQIPGRIIQNPLNNNTIYPQESKGPLVDYAETRLLKTEDPNYSQHIRLMERNIIGSDVYAFVDAFCYSNDTCLVSGWIQMGNLKPIEIYNYTINITLNQTVSKYNSINYQSLKQIKDFQGTLDGSLDSLKTLYSTFLADNRAFINNFIQTMDTAIDRFETIFEEISNLTSLEPYIEQIIAIIQPQFDAFQKNYDSYATNHRQWFDFIAWNFNSAVSDLQCLIKANKTLMNQSIGYVPSIYQNFSGLFSNQLQDYYNILLNGIHNQSIIVINQLVNISMSKIANDSNLSAIVSNYVNKRLSPFFVSMQTNFDQAFTTSKILYNLKYVEAAESINGTMNSFINFLTNSNISCNNPNALNWNISVLLVPNNIDDIYASFHFQSESSALVSFSTEANSSLQPIIDQLVKQMVSEIKLAIFDSNATFTRLYNETTVNLTQTKYSIKENMLTKFEKFKSDVQQIFSDPISTKANQTLLVFQKLGDPAYAATQKDVQNIDYAFLNQTNAEKAMSSYSSSLDALSSWLDDTNTSYYSTKRILQGRRRLLTTLPDSIYDNHYSWIQNKTSQLNSKISEASASVIHQCQILDYFNLTIAPFNLSGFQTDYINLFSEANGNFSTLVLEQVINEGKNLKLPKVSILQQNLSKSLDTVLSSANQEIGLPSIKNITQNHSLFNFPGLVGNFDVNLLLAMNSSMRVEMVSGRKNISLKFILDAQVGGIIKTQANGENRQEGLFVLTDLFRGSSVTTFAYNFENLAKFNKLEQNIQNLGVQSGIFSRDCQAETLFKCFQLQQIFNQELETCLPVKKTNCDPVQKQFEVNQQSETLMDQYPLI